MVNFFRLICLMVFIGLFSTTMSCTHYKLSDDKATPETILLYAKLIINPKIMFGQFYNVPVWEGDDGYKTDMECYKICKKNPKILNVDYLISNRSITQIEDKLKIHYAQGGIIMLGWTMINFVTGGTAWDTSGNVAENILPGGNFRTQYLTALDGFANWVSNFKDSHGCLIPIIFRPFHENDGNWFWWGIKGSTPEQYKKLWIDLQNYLKNRKGLHNLLYCYSPEMINGYEYDGVLYPGDQYVDVLGLDFYARTITHVAAWPGGNCLDRLQKLADLSDAKGKPFGLCEGLRGEYPNTIVSDPSLPGIYPNYWTEQFFNPIINDKKAKKIAFVCIYESNPKTTPTSTWGWGPFVGSPDSFSFIELSCNPKVEFLENKKKYSLQTRYIKNTWSWLE